MTVVVLAIDALDSGLVEYFEFDALKLESYGRMETFAYMKSEPFTPEALSS